MSMAPMLRGQHHPVTNPSQQLRVQLPMQMVPGYSAVKPMRLVGAPPCYPVPLHQAPASFWPPQKARGQWVWAAPMKPTGPSMKVPSMPAAPAQTHTQERQTAVKVGTAQPSPTINLASPAPAQAGCSEACPNVVSVKVGAPQPRQDIKLTIEGEVAPAPGVEKIPPADFQRLWQANLVTWKRFC